MSAPLVQAQWRGRQGFGRSRASGGKTIHWIVFWTTFPFTTKIHLRVNAAGLSIRTEITHLGAKHRRHKGLNNRTERSHRPTRKRGKSIGRFKSPRQARRLLAAHDQINGIFRPRRYRLSATSYRPTRSDAFDLWTEYALEMTA